MYAGSPDIIQEIQNGSVRTIARLITQVEQNSPERIKVLKRLHQYTGNAHVIGITGPPGAGKSTVTDKLIGEFRKHEKRVAVIAVDPSSPFTGGAILGDRIRMMAHATDPHVFIRSLASRGHLGGLAEACGETIRILDAARYDIIIIETVGVGQSEVEIVRYADTVVLVTVPGLGDDIQAIKAGIMEIGDIFCVNKADKEGTERTVREIRAMLETAVLNNAPTRFTELYSQYYKHHVAEQIAQSSYAGHHGITSIPGHELPIPLPPVVTTIAETGKNIEELCAEIMKHYTMLCETGILTQRRNENLLWEIKNMVIDRIAEHLDSQVVQEKIHTIVSAVQRRELDLFDASRNLFEFLLQYNALKMEET